MPPLAGHPTTSLEEGHLRSLIDGASEGRTLDFKRDGIGTNDEAKREFLADVSSLANTAGGHIIIGMDENEGVASELVGVELVDADAEKLRLEAIVRDGLDPRLPSVGIQAVPLEGGRWVLIIDVGHSWLAPHMVTFRGQSRFFGRNSAGKFQMDRREIALAIMGSETRVAQIRQFHGKRVDAVVTGSAVEGGVLAHRQGILLHLIPLAALDVSSHLDLDEPTLLDRDMRPLYSEPMNYPVGRFNLDGIFVADTGTEAGAGQYLQVYRNGIIETFDSRLLNFKGPDTILGYPVERTLINDTRRLLALMKRLGANAPLVVLVTIIGAGGRSIVTADRFDPRGHHTVDRELLPLPEVVIEDFDVDTSKALKPILDALWQAGGYPRSPNFNTQGDWQQQD